MSSESAPSESDLNNLRTPTRYITTHDSFGKSILTSNNILFFREFAGGITSRAYAVPSVPVQLSNDQDLQSYQSEDGEKHATSYTLAGRQTTVPNGVNMTYLDLAPGASTAMHRTVSLDFVVVIEGEIEMTLDGGDKVLLKSGVRKPASCLMVYMK